MSQPEPCAHYDIVGPHPLFPDQAKDIGTCRYCGRQRKYDVGFVDTGYNDLRVQRPGYFASERDIIGYVAELRERDV